MMARMTTRSLVHSTAVIAFVVPKSIDRDQDVTVGGP